MMRRRLAGAAVRLYPLELRTGRGAELLATALDAGDASRRAFAVQLGSLVVAGFGARCRVALGESPKRVVVDAFGWAAVLAVSLPCVLFFADQLRFGGLGGSLSSILIGYAVPTLILARCWRRHASPLRCCSPCSSSRSIPHSRWGRR